MTKLLTHRMKTGNAEATERLGGAIGRKLKGSEVIELVSDLGGGKTVFVRGLARGMGSTARVTSPTFTISQEYPAGKLTLYHFDFYRLGQAGIVADELSEVIGDSQAVTVVEWGDIVADVLPNKRMTISIRAVSENDRDITIAYPGSLAYLVEGIK